MLASGRVVAAGTVAGIVGQVRTTVVRVAALRRLQAAGIRAVLSGETLRVPGRRLAWPRRSPACPSGSAKSPPRWRSAISPMTSLHETPKSP